MRTVSYRLFNHIDESDDIRNIYNHGKDLAAAFKTIEFNIVEVSDLEYIYLISENQRDIFLKNINSLIEIHFRLKANNISRSFSHIHYRELRKIFGARDAGSICDCLFSSIFNLFYAIDDEASIGYCHSGTALSEITFMVKSYLKYIGKEDKLDGIMEKVKEAEDSFRQEEDIILPLKIDDKIIVPENIILPSTIKYEVRREIDGLFYGIISEESVRELFEHKKELIELAYNNYDYVKKRFWIYGDRIYPVFYYRIMRKENDLILAMLVKIIIMVSNIAEYQKYPGEPSTYLTSRRHLEEIHILAQECLKIKFFDLHYAYFSKEITDSAQLAQLIDTNIQTLDPPTGSRTKPAIRDD